MACAGDGEPHVGAGIMPIWFMPSLRPRTTPGEQEQVLSARLLNKEANLKVPAHQRPIPGTPALAFLQVRRAGRVSDPAEESFPK